MKVLLCFGLVVSLYASGVMTLSPEVADTLNISNPQIMDRLSKQNEKAQKEYSRKRNQRREIVKQDLKQRRIAMRTSAVQGAKYKGLSLSGSYVGLSSPNLSSSPSVLLPNPSIFPSALSPREDTVVIKDEVGIEQTRCSGMSCKATISGILNGYSDFDTNWGSSIMPDIHHIDGSRTECIGMFCERKSDPYSLF